MASDAVVLNELSLPSVDGGESRGAVLDQFSSLLAAIRTVRPPAYLVSPVRLWGEGASAYAVLGSWAQLPENRDKLRQILGMQNRAPYEAEFGVLDGALLEEYAFQGARGVGLGYAYRLDLLAVSLLTSARFDAEALVVERWSTSDSDAELAVQKVRVRHAARKEHVEQHNEFLVLGADPRGLGDKIWLSREQLFGRIDFLDRVKGDIDQLQSRELMAVREKLVGLQAALAGWDSDVTPEPVWPSKVTPESASRIAAGVCAFRNSDGELRDYSLHARFTPGPGRIHFSIDPKRGRIEVAYIGRKLG